MRQITTILILLLVCSSQPTWAGPEEVLEEGKATRYLRLRDDQVPTVNSLLDSIRSTISEYQWARGLKTNEGRIWEGEITRVKDLHQLESRARTRISGFVDSLETGLDRKQKRRLERAFGKKDVLTFEARELPFDFVNNSPLHTRFNRNARTYRSVIPGNPAPLDSWPYSELLQAWSTRGFVQFPLAMDQREYAEVSGLQFRESSPSIRSLVVKSPLIVAGTLFSPDLALREFDVLWTYYDREGDDRETAWQEFRSVNRLEDALLIRLKVATPLQDYYLRMERYIIYLEDSEGTGYEPIEIREEGERKLEALEIHIPGQQVEVTDVFGRYTGIPGYKEHRWLSYPAEVKYTGHEKLLKIFFPGFNFRGDPIVTEKIRSLKLILKPEDGAFPPIELEWEMKRKPPQKLTR